MAGNAPNAADPGQRPERGGVRAARTGKGKGAVVIRSAWGTAAVLAVWLGFVGAVQAAEQQRKLTAGQVFRDCDGCPEMVVVPAGSFMMGSPSSEKGRFDFEGPLHEVAIREPFAVGVYEVTRGEFARFVSVSGHSPRDSCGDYYFSVWGYFDLGRNWNQPGYGQTDDHPVVCVSWEDAKAYARWLSRETGEEYRLLSEAEWEYAARGGSATARYWGEGEDGQCRHVNGADSEAKDWADREAKDRDSEIERNWEKQYRDVYGRIASCNDGHVHTAPVGSYEANGFGLHDVLGNVGEWVEDCVVEKSYRGAPSDGSAWVSGDCSRRVLRGGSWISSTTLLRSAFRYASFDRDRVFYIGFRVARTLAR